MAQPNSPIKQETLISRKTASHLYKEFYRFSGNREDEELAGAEGVVKEHKNAKPQIDYKKLSANYFNKSGVFTATKTDLNASASYLTDEIVSAINLEEENTVLINVDLGSGKSTSILKIITELLKDDNNIIISATPFKTLVQKEYLYLTSDNKDVTQVDPIDEDLIFDYRLIDDNTFHDSLDFDAFANENKVKPIQLITVNLLLANPGENAFMQAGNKRSYLAKLRSYCIKNNKKVYFLFDELHESVKNFKSELAYNWRLWKDITHKVLVSTATYTEAAKIVVQHIAYNTSDKIHIIEAPRIKKAIQGDLKLYFCKDTYSSNNLTELDYIQYIAEENEKSKTNNSLDKTYNNLQILSYSKKLSMALANQDFWGTLSYSINLTVSDANTNTKREFDRTKTNIGTTFKTGVNIRDNDLLIILLPPNFSAGLKQKGEEGIFQDGLPSILQSVARLRGAGDIIVFVPPVKHLMSESYDILKDMPHIQLFEPNNTETYNPINDEFNLIDNFYNNYTAPIKDEIDKDKKDKGRPTIQFPTLNNFILDRGQDFLVYSKLSSGKYAYPLLLHYALKNKFTNCTLTEIITHEYIVKELRISDNNLFNDLYGYFDSIIGLMPTTENLYMEDVVEHLKNNLLKYKYGTDEEQQIDIYVDNAKKYNNEFVRIIKYFNVMCSYALKKVKENYEYYNNNLNMSNRFMDDKIFRPNEALAQDYKIFSDFVINMITKGKDTFNNYFPKRKYNAGNFIEQKEIEKL